MSRANRYAPLFAGIAALSLLLVLAACSDNQGKGNEPTATSTPTPAPKPTPTPFYTPTAAPAFDVKEARAELAAAKARWEVGGTADYELGSLVWCHCPESNRPLKFTVRNGVIESAIDLESGRALTERDYNNTYTFHTISDRFDQIERALSDPRPVYYLIAEYHPELGYPTYLEINYQAYMIGDGFELKRLIYKPLDPTPPPATSTLSLDDVVTPTPTVTPTPVTPTPEPVYDVEEARAELAAARARWRVGGSTDYELESLVSCPCPESDRPLKITVRGGVIESVIDLESGRSLTEREYNDTYTFHTIGDRFDQIEDALRDPWPVYYLRAEYHPTLGYPTSMAIIYRHNVNIDAFSLERLIYKPLDPSPPPATSTLSLDTEGRRASVLGLFSGGDAMLSIGPAATVEEVLERGLRLAGASPVHLAFRGTAVANSARCEWRGIARTAGQREDAIRYWLELDADDEIPHAAYLEGLFTIALDTLDPNFRETAKSNFLAIARGGLSEEYLFLSCFADYSVSEYLLGTGAAPLPPTGPRNPEKTVTFPRHPFPVVSHPFSPTSHQFPFMRHFSP